MSDPDKLTAMPRGKLLAALVLQAITISVAGAAIWWWTGRPLAGLLAFTAEDALWSLALTGLLLATLLVLYRFFPPVVDRLARLQAGTYAFLAEKLTFPQIVLVSLCAGIGEETLVRAGIQTALGDWLGLVPAIALAALLFAAMHGARPLVFGLLLVIGVLFGAVFHVTGSLVAVALAHTLYDIVALKLLQDRMHALRLFDETGVASAETAR